MRWLALAAAALVALAAIVVIVGALLPRDHVAAVAARIAAPPAAVWAVLTDPAAFPTWRGDVRRVELLPATFGAGAWREHGRHGAVSYVVDAAVPPRRLVTRIADAGLPYGGAWEWRIEPDGDAASRVTVIESCAVYNPVFRFVSRFVLGHTATLSAQLRALGRRFGDEPVPLPVDLVA
jgi:uncharacterized protein YndB with AHSA1/START domain